MGLVALAEMVVLELHQAFQVLPLPMLVAAALVVQVVHHQAVLVGVVTAHTTGQEQQAEPLIQEVVAVAHKQ